jgi:O-antigen ligase
MPHAGRIRYVVNAGVVVALSAATVAPEFSHRVLAILALLGIAEIILQRDVSWRLPPEIIALIAIPFIAWLMTAMAIMAGIEIPRMGWRKLEDISWVLLLVPAWLLWRRHLDLRAVALGVALGAVISGIWALWEVAGHPESYRAIGMMRKAIVFGLLSMALATVSLGLSFCFPRRVWVQSAMIAAAVLGFLAAVLSGSRGTYLALPLIVLLFWWLHRKNILGKVHSGILAGVCVGVIAVGVAAWNFTSMPERVTNAWDEVSSYTLSEKTANSSAGRTSIGLRFEMWKAASSEVLSHPLLGVGIGNVHAVLVRAADRGQINFAASHFDHVHNEYINAAVTRGVLGFIASLMALLVPALMFRKFLQVHQCVAITGLGIVLLFAFSGLTDSVFYFKKDFLMYATLIMLLSAVIWRKSDNDADSVR